MSSTRSLARAVAIGALVLTGAAVAQTTATQTAGTTVTSVNKIALTAGGTLAFTPTVGTADQDATTTLSFESNDGNTYRITVVADTGGWTFTPSVTGKTTSVYPVLKFVSATTTGGGTGSSTAAELISSADAVATAVNVVTGITNVSGSTTVTLESSITQAVVAGSYSAGLTYTLATP